MLPFKFAAGRAKCICLYKSLRTKAQRCCANIYFNQQCLKQGVIPKYAQDPKVCIASCDLNDKNRPEDDYLYSKHVAYENALNNKVVVLTYTVKYYITGMLFSVDSLYIAS
jgi:hypothetical protein